MIRYLAVFLLFFVSSEKIELKRLADGVTPVPADEEYFTKNYRTKYNVKLPAGVEPNVLYVTSDWPKYYSSAIMFYENGCVNNFRIYPKHEDMTLDPDHQGYRGMCFEDKGKKRIAIISRIDGTNIYGENLYKIKIKGDKLMKRYVKSNIWVEFNKDKSGIKTNYTANW